MQVIIKEYVEKKPNGDRADTKVDSSRFDITLNEAFNGAEEGSSFCVKSFDSFDPYHTTVKGRALTFGEAKRYALNLSAFLNCSIWHYIMQEEVVTEKKWTTLKINPII